MRVCDWCGESLPNLLETVSMSHAYLGRKYQAKYFSWEFHPECANALEAILREGDAVRPTVSKDEKRRTLISKVLG